MNIYIQHVLQFNVKKYQKIPKMVVITAIMEKTVKNTGGVAALQKMKKNSENGLEKL